jgi:hypothetical protein
MKTRNKMMRLMPISLAIVVMLIFIIKTGSAQEKKNESSEKTMKIKIVKENDGKVTVIDTTIYGKMSMDEEELSGMIASLKADMKEPESDMKNINLDIAVQISDSSELDSLEKQIKKVIVMGSGCCKGKYNVDCMPHAYKYDFHCDPDLSELQEIHGGWNNMDDGEFNFEFPSPPMDYFRYNDNREGSLNDLLGNIPMERVKSYSIKDTKKGKKITIEVENGPLFESRSKTIIIKNPSRSHSMKTHGGKPDQNVKVIIKAEKEQQKEQKEKSTEEFREQKNKM